MQEKQFDPLDPNYYLDPHKHLAELRRVCPVSEPAPWYVFVTRYNNVRQALRNTDALSNAGDLIFPQWNEDPPTVLQMDPPEHTRLRRFQTHLSPNVVAGFASAIREVVGQLIDSFVAERKVEIMEAFAFLFPTYLTMNFIGIPDEQKPEFQRWMTEIQSRLPYQFKYHESWQQFTQYMRRLIPLRRDSAELQTDMLTHLIQYEKDGDRLTDEEIRMAVFQLISAGANVSLVTGSLLFELLRRHELWEQVYADRTLIPVAVEEALRHDPSSPWVMRLCQQEMMIGDVKIEPGKRVMLSIASANRDEEEMGPDPDTFSLERGASKHTHLSFGYGPHFCLGAPLARLQITIALEELLDRLPFLRLAPDFKYEGINAAMLHGPQKLEVCW